MPRLRTLIVEDSPTVRERLRAILLSDPDFEVVGVADDGKSAIELCREHRPDVITMDMMLPVMTGLAATEYIMAHMPTPILVVSASFNRGEVFRTYEALAAGAVDVLEKPRGDEPEGAWEARFLSTLKLVARIKVITHPRARLRPPDPQIAPARRTEPPSHGRMLRVAGIGASTGGPGAIVEVIRSLPEDFTLPVLLVLHIDGRFGGAFAEWLDGQTPRPASFARDGESVAAAAGRVVLAPPDQHLVVREGRLYLNRDPERFSCRPSVDVLFESIAREYGGSAAACLLTGMGRDGARGLLAIREAGGATIAQDEATSVVYGMPREAALIGAATRILPVGEIGPTLGAMARRPAGAGA
jgi:two-component system chemotaxis response regulator CheB